ncbi:tetratricopeptide repeat protein [Pseudoxanthomonas mexicana]|uniref:tetratricopeptide repeat protein n=1 Tax=Pseudoxanthomonas mexicana TaxID=128785 RepID=UPI00398B3363
MGDRDAPKLWHFGRVMLDERGPVSVGGETVALDRSGFDVLLALLRHAGEVVTKDELLAAGWPGRVVSENTLNKAISRLRQALGGDGEAIKAVYGYGYRLAAIVRVQAVDDGGEAGATPTHGIDRLRPGEPLPLRPQWRMERWLGQGAAGAVALARDAAGQARVFKFAVGEAGLRGLRREVALARYLQAAADGVAGVAPLLGWNLAQPPFFAEMPYYPEGDLRDWAERDQRLKSLPPPARVELCAQICETVAALHAAGVIHKDLKPDNLYPLADAGAPHGWRLLLGDLGAGEAALSPQLAELGMTHSLVAVPYGLSPDGGSLLYLAPEVLAGHAATQQSDVYALGVLLYQLLAGDLRRPLAPGWEADVGDPLLREDIALAAAVEPEQRQLDARTLAQRLRGLDARRAEHAAALIEAERQWRRDAQLQRLRQRWRWGLALSIGLACGLTVALWMFWRAENARLQAERNQRRAEAVQAFLTRDLLLEADPYTAGASSDVSVRQAIEAAAGKVDRRFHDQPDSAIAIYHSIADVYSGWGEYARAVGMLQRARQQAAHLRGNPAALAEVDRHLCEELRMAGDVAAARAACAAALAGFDVAGVRSDAATVTQAKVMFEVGEWTQAVRALDLVVVRLDGSASPRLLADALWFRALSLRKLARFVQADADFRRLIALQQRERGEHHPMTGWALADYGDFLVDAGRFSEAEAVLDRAQAIFDAGLPPGHPDALGPGYSRAEMHLWKGQWQPAIALLEPRVRQWRETLGNRHFWTLYALTELAWAKAEAGEADAAAMLLREARASGRLLLAGHDAKSAFFHARWARTLLALRDAEAAALELRELDAALAAHYAADHPWRATASCLHARMALLRRRPDVAVRLAADCRAGLLRRLPADHPALAEPARLLALATAAR